jgi:hypothetical protein
MLGIFSHKETKMLRVVFDLDGTVINSDHRKVTRSDGSIDLAHWRENCTRQKILQDSLLPLAQSMKNCRLAGYKIIICTARIIQQADLEFLDLHGLYYDAILHRVLGDERPDAILKAELLQKYFDNDFNNVIMFDDNLSVISKMVAIGIKCYDAKRLNEGLAKNV